MKKQKKNISEGILQYPNGQEAHLYKLMKRAFAEIGLGVFLLILCRRGCFYARYCTFDCILCKNICMFKKICRYLHHQINHISIFYETFCKLFQ